MGGMTRLLLLLLWVGVAVSTHVDLQKRIIGGDACRVDERQYHVKFVDKNNKLISGGSLISDSWILTKAGLDEEGMRPVLGVHPCPGQGKKGEIILKRPYSHLNHKHDIMLLKLRDPITTIQPVNLPDCSKRPTVGDMVQVAGHGPTTLGPNGKRIPGEASTLQCVDLKIVDDAYQTSLDTGGYMKQYGKSHFKLYQTNGKDVSFGDFGAGVVYNKMIYGVNAFTNDVNNGGVASAGFVDICAYKDWIEKTAGVKFKTNVARKPKSG